MLYEMTNHEATHYIPGYALRIRNKLHEIGVDDLLERKRGAGYRINYPVQEGEHGLC